MYLLLRNNQQTGPYTLEQLVQLNLKPFDLVWVEGRSAAWQYPGEVAALKPYVPAPPAPEQPYMPVATSVLDNIPEAQVAAPVQPAPQATVPAPASPPAPAAKKIFVSMPARTAAQAATPPPIIPPATAPTPAPSPYSIPPEPVVPSSIPTPTPAPSAKPAQAAAGPETRYARSLDDVEEAYSSWMYDKKTKKKKFEPRDIAIAVVLLLIIAGGYFLLSQPGLTATHAAPKQAAVVATAVPQPSEEQLPVEQEPVQQQQAAAPTSTLEAAHVSTDTHAAVATPATKPVKEKAANTVPAATRSAEAVPAEAPARTVVDQPSETRAAQASAPAKGEEQKKKKLRDVFKDMFGKNKAKDKPVAQSAPAEQPRETPRTRTASATEEPRPANNRQAARRGDDGGSETATTAAAPQENAAPLTDQVDLFSNAPGNWMMGVSGLKVTLRNRSSSALQSASVDVLYYDQNNKLLDRKTLNFSGVPAKGRQTLAAPDHKWADHVDYKLQSVTAKDDRYARG